MWTLARGTLKTSDGIILLENMSPHFALETAELPDAAFLKFAAEPSPRHQITLGTPRATRFTAAFRNEPFWMRPAVCGNASEIPIETQLLFARLPDGRAALLVPLVDGKLRCALQGGPAAGGAGELFLIAETGNAQVVAGEALALFMAVQPTGERDLNAWLARCASALARRQNLKLRHEKPLPKFVDSFGWCTWDAFYTDVSEEKLREGLETFRAAGVPPKLVILDDGWQSEINRGDQHGRRLTSLAPNEKFGHNLSHATRMAKTEFGVEHFIVWHAFEGYWSGIDPEYLPRYASRETPRDFSPGILHHFPDANHKYWGHVAGVIPPEKIAGFFDDYHALLKLQGVDGVKVDNQATLEGLAGAFSLSRSELYAAYRRGLETSVQKNFAGTMINCMSCANDILYGIERSTLTRTSVDFWPARPETHGIHLWTNALVGLWFGQFIHPDWDMFQSNLPEPHHAWSAYHAAARAICGGPVYVSDKPGQHDAALLKKIVYSDGTIGRTARPATLCADTLFADITREPALLKICSVNGVGAREISGVVGLFNGHYAAEGGSAIAGIACAADVPEIAGHSHYLYFSHRAIAPRVVTADERITISLAQTEWEIATFVPIRGGVAIAGLIDKLNPAGAIAHVARDATHIDVTLRDAGTLGIWCESPNAKLEVDAKEIPITRKGHWLTAQLPSSVRRARLSW